LGTGFALLQVCKGVVPVFRTASNLLAVGALSLATAAHGQDTGAVSASALMPPSAADWPVATSLRTTVAAWAHRLGWPAPQFLTDADWPVDVPGAIPGSIETALAVLLQGFGDAASHPRIVVSANHVIVVSEAGADE